MYIRFNSEKLVSGKKGSPRRIEWDSFILRLKTIYVCGEIIKENKELTI